MRYVLRQNRDALRRMKKANVTRAQLKQMANFAAALLGQTEQVQASPCRTEIGNCRPLVVNRGRAGK